MKLYIVFAKSFYFIRNFILLPDNFHFFQADYIHHSDTPLTCMTSYCMIRTSTQSDKKHYASDYQYIQGGHMYQLDFDKPIHVFFSGLRSPDPTAPLLPLRMNWLQTASRSLSASRRRTSRLTSISSSSQRRSGRTIRSTSPLWKTEFRT